MFANERQSLIEMMLQQKGAVSTAERVSFFCISIDTIRRDLLSLEKNGRLSRVYGGAVSLGSMKSFPSLKERNREQIDAKQELLERACSTYGIAVLSEQLSWIFTLFVWFLIAAAGTAVCFFCIRPWSKNFYNGEIEET